MFSSVWSSLRLHPMVIANALRLNKNNRGNLSGTDWQSLDGWSRSQNEHHTIFKCYKSNKEASYREEHVQCADVCVDLELVMISVTSNEGSDKMKTQSLFSMILETSRMLMWTKSSTQNTVVDLQCTTDGNWRHCWPDLVYLATVLTWPGLLSNSGRRNSRNNNRFRRAS